MLQTIEENRFPADSEAPAKATFPSDDDSPRQDSTTSVFDATINSLRRRLRKLSLPSRIPRNPKPFGQETKPSECLSNALDTDVDASSAAPPSSTLREALGRRWSPVHFIIKAPARKRSQSLRSVPHHRLPPPRNGHPLYSRRLSTVDHSRPIPILIRRKSSSRLGSAVSHKKLITLDGIELEWLARVFVSVVMGSYPPRHVGFESAVGGVKYNIQRLPMSSRYFTRYHLLLALWYGVQLVPKAMIGADSLSTFDSITLVTRVFSMCIRFSLMWLTDASLPIHVWCRHYGLAPVSVSRLERTALEAMKFSIRPPSKTYVGWLDRLRTPRTIELFPTTMETIRNVIDELTNVGFCDLDFSTPEVNSAVLPRLRAFLLVGLAIVGPIQPPGPPHSKSESVESAPGHEEKPTANSSAPAMALSSPDEGTLVESPQSSGYGSGSTTPEEPPNGVQERNYKVFRGSGSPILFAIDPMDECAIADDDEEDDDEDDGDSDVSI